MIKKLLFIFFIVFSMISKANSWERVYDQYSNSNSAIVKSDTGYLLYQTQQVALKLNAFALRLNEDGAVLSSILHFSSDNVFCRNAVRSVWDRNQYILQYEKQNSFGYYYLVTDIDGNRLDESSFAYLFDSNNSATTAVSNQKFLHLENTDGYIGNGVDFVQLDNGYRYDLYIVLKKLGHFPYFDTRDIKINLREKVDTSIVGDFRNVNLSNILFPLKDGGFSVLIPKDDDTSFLTSFSYNLARFDSTGNLKNTVRITNPQTTSFNHKIYEDNTGNLFLTYSEGAARGVVKMIDTAGNIVKTIVTPNLSGLPYNTVVKRIDNDLLLIYSLTENSNQKQRAFFRGVFSLGKNEYVSQKFTPIFTGLDGQYDFFVSGSELLTDDAVVFVGLSRKKTTSENALTIVKIEDNVYPQVIKGNVFGDYQNNCNKNLNDIGLGLMTVKGKKGDKTFFTTTDSAGNYELDVDTGNIELNLYRNINKPFWSVAACTTPRLFTVNPHDTIIHDFAMYPKLICPFLNVDIATPFLRRCVENTYTVTYSNTGTIASSNSYIDVTLDTFLDYHSSTIPAIVLGNNVYRFYIGTIAVNQVESFKINAYLNCNTTIVSQTHCTEAHIYPDTICTAAAYLGPVIAATAKCYGDRVEFTLRNYGGDMVAPGKYQIIEDHVIRASSNFFLNRGNADTFSIRTSNGATYRIIAEQDRDYPVEFGDKFVIAFAEGCRGNFSESFTTGIITSGSLFDGEAYRSLNCMQSIASKDPNDKSGYPVGVGETKLINQNTAIDYLIRFQNTGNDTAFKIIIDDTIPVQLDINSISNLQSSHSFVFKRVDSSLVRWTFNNIRLVDSLTNEPLSHGFIKFRILQKANLPIGTKIYNTAYIYFDYNEPVITNTSLHTIGKDFLRVDIINAVITDISKIKSIKVYPNPFDISAQFILEGKILEHAVLELTDVYGKQISKYESENNKFTVFRNEMPSGMYLYVIKQYGTIIVSGKIVAQ